MRELKIRVTFTNKLYAISPNNPDMRNDFMAWKAKQAMNGKTEAVEELLKKILPNLSDEQRGIVMANNLADEIDKGVLIFPRTDAGLPFIYGYQWKGFFKEKFDFLRNLPDKTCSIVPAWRKKIDGLFFIKDLENPIILPDGQEPYVSDRIVRFDVKGTPTTAFNSCETAPAGTTCEFTVVCFLDGFAKCVQECLEHGRYSGTGGRRNDSHGTFTYELLEGSFDVTKEDLKLIAPKSGKNAVE